MDLINNDKIPLHSGEASHELWGIVIGCSNDPDLRFSIQLFIRDNLFQRSVDQESQHPCPFIFRSTSIVCEVWRKRNQDLLAPESGHSSTPDQPRGFAKANFISQNYSSVFSAGWQQ